MSTKQLPSDVRERLDRLVAAGRFKDTDEALRHAVLLLEEHDHIRPLSGDELESLLRDRMAQADAGRFVESTPESVIARADAGPR